MNSRRSFAHVHDGVTITTLESDQRRAYTFSDLSAPSAPYKFYANTAYEWAGVYLGAEQQVMLYSNGYVTPDRLTTKGFDTEIEALDWLLMAGHEPQSTLSNPASTKRAAASQIRPCG